MIDSHHIAHNWDRYEDFRKKKKTGIVTGFPAIDRNVPCIPGLVTLVGETKLGKSYLTMNIYAHLAQSGIPVVLVDKENGFMRTRTRLLCYLSGLTEPAITSGKFINDEEEKYYAAVEELHKLPIYYFDDIQQEEVEPVISEVGKLHKRRVFLVIDSLNRLIRDFDNRRGDVDSWVTLFNNLKLKYDNFLNIWVICEKNKAGETKESNTIDFITELWLEMYKDKSGSGVVLNCKAQRDGPSGVLATFEHTKPFCYRLQEVENVPE